MAIETISKSDMIIGKFKETVAGKIPLERGMRSMLRDMKNLLRFSEGKLREAQDDIDYLRERLFNVEQTLRVFKALLEGVKEREGGYLAEKDDSVGGIINSVFNGIGNLSKAISKMINRESILPIITRALSGVRSAIDQVTTLHSAMEKEVVLISIWNEAVQVVKYDVFDGNLKDEEDQKFYDEFQEIIDDGDVEFVEYITDSFGSLKEAALNYLNHVIYNI